MIQGREQGFTLIETIFSITIFAIIVLGVFEAYRALYVSAAASEQKLSALELASSRLEEVRRASSVSGSVEAIKRNGLVYEVETSVASTSGYQLVEVGVTCALCRNFKPFSLTARLPE